ncbi:MAG TPA: hypothetical protein VMV89_01305, partial [Candidatus Paceibacterota bacterium]|nr:hypothetical protein [Candidatus Paceibacterota bacterium]
MFQLTKIQAKRFPAVAIGIICLATLCCRAQTPVGVVLEPQNPGREIPADFVGLSFEMQYVLADTNGNHFF